MSENDVLMAAAAIAREGFPKGRESAHDYRMRLARAALAAQQDGGLMSREAVARRMQGANAISVQADPAWETIPDREREHWLFLADAALLPRYEQVEKP